ncbi:MAG: DUF4435 domain-containing protein [Capsulimonas sp.]|uniref:DUF4435 domain-containing protein n=1 Tax=Capsulimonas sp. TaxID=2494211 RepID=UPI00326559FC
MTPPIKPLPPELNNFLFELGPRKLVLVEGADDAEVFEELYLDRLSKIAFFPTGGDERLEALLQELLTQRPDVESFGIRDRDFQSDTDVEASLTASGSRLFVLRRYCIENYLLEPLVVWYVLRVYLSKAFPWSSVKQAEEHLLKLCADMRTMMAANFVLRLQDALLFSKGHELLSREVLVEAVAHRLSKDAALVEAEIVEREAHIDERLHSLGTAYTCISGKHLLFHLFDFARACDKKRRGLSEDYLFRQLLAQIKQQNLIHEDLREIVEQKILAGS